MSIVFENSSVFSISNFGFVDGVLHIQTKASVDGDAFAGGYFINLNLVNNEDEAVYSAALRIDFTDKEHALAENRNDPYDKYSEFIFDNITTYEQLDGLSITIDINKAPTFIDGPWELSLIIAEKVATDLFNGEELFINGGRMIVSKVSISPLGVSVHLPENISFDYASSDMVYVEYQDGTIIELNQSSIHSYENESILIFGGQVIEIEKVQDIIINDERISVLQG